VVVDGDDLGRWLQCQQQPATWARLLPEQQERLARLGVLSAQTLPPAPSSQGGGKGPGQTRKRSTSSDGTRAVGRTGGPGPRGHGERITADGQTEPVTVKLGIWVSNTKSRRAKLTAQRVDALRELGVDWAQLTAGGAAGPGASRS